MIFFIQLDADTRGVTGTRVNCKQRRVGFVFITIKQYGNLSYRTWAIFDINMEGSFGRLNAAPGEIGFCPFAKIDLLKVGTGASS